MTVLTVTISRWSTRLRVDGIVVYHACCGMRRIWTRATNTRYRWELFLDMYNRETATASSRAVRYMTMPDNTLIVDTYTSAVARVHTYTRTLTSMDIAVLYRSAAVHVYTATADRRIAALDGTCAH